MVEEPSHVKKTISIRVCKIGLKWVTAFNCLIQGSYLPLALIKKKE